jgi:hypothetical protein
LLVLEAVLKDQSHGEAFSAASNILLLFFTGVRSVAVMTKILLRARAGRQCLIESKVPFRI